jgi:hypothetical protein
MRTIETNITVASDGRASIELPLPVPAGTHRAVVVLDEAKLDEALCKSRIGSADLPLHDLGPWPANLSLHREDLYDDCGR